MKFLKSFLADFWGSVSRFDFYHKAYARPLRKGFGYFSFLILIAATFLSAYGTYSLYQGLGKAREFVATKAPDFSFTITKGVFSSNLPQPFVFPLDGKAEEATYLVVDTTGQIRDLEPFPSGILISSQSAMFKGSQMESRTFEFKGIDGVKVTRESLISTFQKLVPYLTVAAFILGIVFIWVGLVIAKIPLWFFWSAVTLLIASLTKKAIRFGQILGAGWYCLTMVVVVESVLMILSVIFPSFQSHLPFLSSAVFLVYSLGGILTFRPQKRD